VDRDVERALKCGNWRSLAEDRNACRRWTEEAKVQDEL